MGQLIDGKWDTSWYTPDKKGRFVRSQTQFRQWIKKDRSTAFAPERERYHLYVSLACPWAHRTLILRKLKGLEGVISISVVDPLMGDEGWQFSDAAGAIPDTVNNKRFLWQIYTEAKADYSGRVTVPVLWDKKQHTIVNNESLEIIKMLDTEFNDLAENRVSFYPHEKKAAIDRTIEENYQPINNGVYRSGFATTQEAYEEAVHELFKALESWEALLEKQRYLTGDKLTLADWCFFTTLVRFDIVYVGHFKCNIKRIFDYPNLWNYLKELYQIPGVADTCNFHHIKEHYYRSHSSVNPTRVVPAGPKFDLSTPHDRERLS